MNSLIKQKKKRLQPEFILQTELCEFLEWQYPEVLFLSDTVDKLKLTFPQQGRNKKIQKKHFKCPDLLILEPRGRYCGLFIELKVETPFKINGELKKSEHLEGQQRAIDQLEKKGYYACFSWGFERTVKLIRLYMAKEDHTKFLK